MLGVEPKDTTKPKIGKGRVLFAMSKREHPKQCLLGQQNWGSFKLRVRTYSWRGLCDGEFNIELGQEPSLSDTGQV